MAMERTTFASQQITGRSSFQPQRWIFDRYPLDAGILTEPSNFPGRGYRPQQIVINPVIDPRLVRIAAVVNDQVEGRHGRE